MCQGDFRSNLMCLVPRRVHSAIVYVLYPMQPMNVGQNLAHAIEEVGNMFALSEMPEEFP